MKREWTKDEICEAFEAWYQKTGEIPKADHWKRSGHHEHPAYQTVWITFGGWRQAINSWKKWRMKRKESWTREEIILAIQKHNDKYRFPPIQKEAAFNPELPSAAAVTRCFGSWNKGIEAAGFIPLKRGLTRGAMQRYLPLPKKG